MRVVNDDDDVSIPIVPAHVTDVSDEHDENDVAPIDTAPVDWNTTDVTDDDASTADPIDVTADVNVTDAIFVQL